MDNHRICAKAPCALHERKRIGHLALLDHDIFRNVDAHTREVSVTAGPLEALIIKVTGAAAGIEIIAETTVDRVCASRQGCIKGLWASSRS